jgi:hypothetical protein
MRNSIHRQLLLMRAVWVSVFWLGAFWLAACLTAGTAAWGQDAAAIASKAKPAVSSLDVAVTYDTMLSNVTAGAHFWMQGGSIQVHGQFWRGLGVVADVAGQHTGNINNSGVGLDLVTATFGPRYTWSLAHSRYSVFGQALAGEGFGLNSTFPASPSALNDATTLATQLGGGVNLSLSRRFALRAIEASWVRSQTPNATDDVQNSMRLGAGVVFRLP